MIKTNYINAMNGNFNHKYYILEMICMDRVGGKKNQHYTQYNRQC